MSMGIKRNINFILMLTISMIFITSTKTYAQSYQKFKSKSLDLNPLPHDNLPVISDYSLRENAFKSNAYKQFIDIANHHSIITLLNLFVRLPGRNITDIGVHNRVKKVVEYAKERGIKMSLDLDVRLARHKFAKMYPDELQGSLWLKEVKRSKDHPVKAVVRSIKLSDHMTGGRITNYISVGDSLFRVYSYHKTDEGIIEPNSLKDITKECKIIISSADSVVVRIPTSKKGSQSTACVMVSFTRLTPAVFSPHLMEFQRNIIQDYSDVPLAGGLKDEWGFPPSYPIMNTKELGHFWYSKYYAAAYTQKTGGRELLADCLLMYVGIKGQKRERLMAINHYMQLNWQRNSALVDDFYRTIKKVFGPEATMTSHATWWPYPNRFEFRKDGLDWWTARRDRGQTDETTPFAVRTALAKKWGSSVWYNQYHHYFNGSGTNKDEVLKAYQQALWSTVLGGGRVDYLTSLKRIVTDGDLLRGISRVRLLDFITKSPLNCPVAVVFGHAAAMNWAGPDFNDVGMGLVDSLWSKGIPTDLIPTSEIQNHSLTVDKNGWVRYGKQRYAAVILYNPEFEEPSTAEFFRQAAKRGQTKLFRIGDWTRDFNGYLFGGNAALPQAMAVSTIKSVMSEIPKIMKRRGISFQTPATRVLKSFAHPSNASPTTGFCRLIDSTLIQIAGTHNAAGDVINSTKEIGKYDVSFNAVGVAAVRLDKEGHVQALAAGGLKYFKIQNFSIHLDKRVDLALWRNDNGGFSGVVQGLKGEIPPQLLSITKDWMRISIPVPLPE